MAESQDRNVGEQVGGSSTETKQPTKPKSGTIRIAPGTESAGRNDQSRPAQTSRTKPTARVAVEISDSESVPEGRIAQPKDTPRPKVQVPAAKRVTLSAAEAKQSSEFALTAVQVMLVGLAGNAGEMSPTEYGMVQPALQRILQRTPVGMIERANPLIDWSVLLIGSGLYLSRVGASAGWFQNKQKSKGVSEDVRAPHAAPVEQIVSRPAAGDRDGIAVPVPDIIARNMNGNV